MKVSIKLRWSKHELQVLKQQTSNLVTGERIRRIVWQFVSHNVSVKCGIRRTAKACENMFYRTHPNRISNRWSVADITRLQFIVRKQRRFNTLARMAKTNWNDISKCFKNRTAQACKQKFYESIR
jgi:hypothetical protein